jgi:hypothetical protein
MTQKRTLFVGEGSEPSARQRAQMDAAKQAGRDVEYRQLGKGAAGARAEFVVIELAAAPIPQEDAAQKGDQTDG